MECSMLKWTAAAALTVTLPFAGFAVAPAAVAAPTAVQESHASKAIDISARRRHRHRHLYVYHPYYPYYYGHPSYYSPGPFLLPWFDASDPW
jgi:hypothetical protein